MGKMACYLDSLQNAPAPTKESMRDLGKQDCKLFVNVGAGAKHKRPFFLLFRGFGNTHSGTCL